MPFLRFSRDKRGYEHIYLIHAQNRRGKPGRPRVLYWYRTPPGVKVGRVPFDAEMRRMLEAQYPDVSFDWKSLESTPAPPPDTSEPWRERRRLERAAKQARKGEPVEGEAVDQSDSGDRGPSQDLVAAAEAFEPFEPFEPATPDLLPAAQIEALNLPEDRDDAGDQPAASIGSDVAVPAAVSNGSPQAMMPSDSRNPAGRRRRRRRGGRRHARPGQMAPADGAPNASPAETSEILENTSESTIDDRDSADE